MSDWISVSERVPKNGQLVIVAIGNRDHFQQGAYKWRNPKSRFWDIFTPSYKDIGVFAWMPMPRPEVPPNA